MVLNLASFCFEARNTASINFKKELGIISIDRLRALPIYQAVTLGKESISLECISMPFIDGADALKPLYALANKRRACSLANGKGEYLGKFVILDIDESKSRFLDDGVGLRVNFNLKLERCA